MFSNPTDGPSIDTEYTYKGVEAALLENQYLRIMVLPGKGGDILEFRDKRKDINILWNADHTWVPPGDRYIPSEALTTWQTDHYPGGWQLNLPIAGEGRSIEGSAYGLHGESALIPWNADVVCNNDEVVTLRMRAELLRYPFYIERELTLPTDESQLLISESVTNRGNVELEYIWQQHITLGPPLIGPSTRLNLPAQTGHVEEYDDEFPNARLKGGTSFEWPHAPARNDEIINLEENFPSLDACIHDLVFASDLYDGQYILTNTEIDLGFEFSFPKDLFECVWYWQPFGGCSEAPFYNRNYNIGLEPTTAYPGGSIPIAQRENGTMKTLSPNETITAEFVAQTYTEHKSLVGNFSEDQ